MKRFLTAVAVAGFSFGMLAGCNDYNNSIQYNTGPQIANSAPSGVAAGNPSFLLTVNAQSPIGNPFQSATAIQWNGRKLNTTFLDGGRVTATITADMVVAPGRAIINTLTPQSGTGQNGLSNSIYFNIYGSPNPVPTLTDVSPNSAPACGTSCANASVTITVTGSNFLPSSNSGGTSVMFADKLTPTGQPKALTVTSLSATQIKAVIPGIYLANADTGSVTVCNPPNIPGGGGCFSCQDQTCTNLAGGGSSTNSISFTIGGGAAAAATAAIAEETPAISQDGRYVVYGSQQNQVNQILLKDTCVGISSGCNVNTRVVSVTADGTAGNADSHNAVVTSDGRYVAFSSAATNLMEGAPAGRQVYVHDTCIGADNTCKTATTLVSTDSQGALNGTEGILPSISSTGRFVAFVAITPTNTPKVSSGAAANLQAAPNSGLRQVFVRDTCLGAANCTPKTTRISMVPGDAPANGTKPAGPAISGVAKQIALADGKSSTVFTPTVAVDEGVVLAVPKEQ